MVRRETTNLKGMYLNTVFPVKNFAPLTRLLEMGIIKAALKT
jgi:hypothetical protein